MHQSLVTQQAWKNSVPTSSTCFTRKTTRAKPLYSDCLSDFDRWLCSRSNSYYEAWVHYKHFTSSTSICQLTRSLMTCHHWGRRHNWRISGARKMEVCMTNATFHQQKISPAWRCFYHVQASPYPEYMILTRTCPGFSSDSCTTGRSTIDTGLPHSSNTAALWVFGTARSVKGCFEVANIMYRYCVECGRRSVARKNRRIVNHPPPFHTVL
jgi:hypothetical protein